MRANIDCGKVDKARTIANPIKVQKLDKTNLIGKMSVSPLTIENNGKLVEGEILCDTGSQISLITDKFLTDFCSDIKKYPISDILDTPEITVSGVYNIKVTYSNILRTKN